MRYIIHINFSNHIFFLSLCVCVSVQKKRRTQTRKIRTSFNPLFFFFSFFLAPIYFRLHCACHISFCSVWLIISSYLKQKRKQQQSSITPVFPYSFFLLFIFFSFARTKRLAYSKALFFLTFPNSNKLNLKIPLFFFFLSFFFVAVSTSSLVK